MLHVGPLPRLVLSSLKGDTAMRTEDNRRSRARVACEPS